MGFSLINHPFLGTPIFGNYVWTSWLIQWDYDGNGNYGDTSSMGPYGNNETVINPIIDQNPPFYDDSGDIMGCSMD